MKTIFALLPLVVLLSTSFAQDKPPAPAPTELVEKTFETSAGHKLEIEKMLELLKTGASYERGMLVGFETATGLHTEQFQLLPAEQRAKITSSTEKAKKYMLSEMGWPKVKDSIVGLYAKTFSEVEARSINKLIDSEAGRLLMTRQLDILPDMMRVGQAKSQEMMPGLMKILQEGMGKE